MYVHSLIIFKLESWPRTCIQAWYLQNYCICSFLLFVLEGCCSLKNILYLLLFVSISISTQFETEDELISALERKQTQNPCKVIASCCISGNVTKNLCILLLPTAAYKSLFFSLCWYQLSVSMLCGLFLQTPPLPPQKKRCLFQCMWCINMQPMSGRNGHIRGQCALAGAWQYFCPYSTNHSFLETVKMSNTVFR